MAGVKHRETKQVQAKVIDEPDEETLHLFIQDRVEDRATVYTDGSRAYNGLDGYEH